MLGFLKGYLNSEESCRKPIWNARWITSMVFNLQGRSNSVRSGLGAFVVFLAVTTVQAAPVKIIEWKTANGKSRIWIGDEMIRFDPTESGFPVYFYSSKKNELRLYRSPKEYYLYNDKIAQKMDKEFEAQSEETINKFREAAAKLGEKKRASLEQLFKRMKTTKPGDNKTKPQYNKVSEPQPFKEWKAVSYRSKAGARATPFSSSMEVWTVPLKKLPLEKTLAKRLDTACQQLGKLDRQLTQSNNGNATRVALGMHIYGLTAIGFPPTRWSEVVRVYRGNQDKGQLILEWDSVKDFDGKEDPFKIAKNGTAVAW